MIHPTAIVHVDTRLGEGCKVWQFASVIRKARLGNNCTVGAGAIVDGARIKDYARIGAGAQVHPGTVAGEHLFLGPGAIVTNDLWPWLDAEDFDVQGLVDGRRASVIIEDHVTIGAGAIILAGVRLGSGCVIAAGAVVDENVPGGVLFDRGGEFRSVPVPPCRVRSAI